MENKKLVKILLKDMGELEDLIAEIKANKKFDALEIEFLHTRAKGILQLLQMLGSENEIYPAQPVSNFVSGEERPNPETDDAAFIEVEDAVNESVPVEPSADKSVNEWEDLNTDQPETQPADPGITAQEVNGIPESRSGHGNDVNDMLEEEIEKAEAVSRLGDSFLKGKSVIDIKSEQPKLEFKLSNRPVSSIQTAIGINDRFQYIRELFDGDNRKFLETVKALDSKQNIGEAVEYLRDNFKWKRNETSLKFVNLVKRRFLNE